MPEALTVQPEPKASVPFVGATQEKEAAADCETAAAQLGISQSITQALTHRCSTEDEESPESFL